MYRPENQPDYPTPQDYVAACREHFSQAIMLPWPTCHEELIALDRFNPRWANCFGGFVPDEWYSHRPPPPPEPEPEPELLDDEEQELFLQTLARDDEFREAVTRLIGRAS